MNVKECYQALEGDYNEIMGRLMTEERVKRFLLMFLKDLSFENLCEAMQSGDYELAFRSAHTLKGTCMNLGLSRLQKSSEAVTEALRGNVNNGADALMPALIDDYTLTINAIKALD